MRPLDMIPRARSESIMPDDRHNGSEVELLTDVMDVVGNSIGPLLATTQAVDRKNLTEEEPLGRGQVIDR